MKILDAVTHGDVEEVDKIISVGGNIDIVDRQGRTALMLAVIGSKADLAERLLNAGANVDACDRGGWTALHFAAQNESSTLVSLLLSYNAKIDALDSYGNTPLFLAVGAYRGADEAITTLLKRGADMNLVNKHGSSPKKLAFLIANYDVRKFFE